MATKKLKPQETATGSGPKYDPNKKWGWQPDDKITFTGMEFHKINTALSDFITSNMDVPTVLKLAEAFSIVQNKLAQYVELGVIKELPNQA